MISVFRIQGDEFICFCPLHEDSNPSLWVNLKKGGAICFAGCFEGSVVDLVSKIELLPKVIAWKRIVQNDIFDFSTLEKKRSIAGRDYIEIANNGLVWSPGDYTSYLLDRGFARSTIRVWDIQYSSQIRHIRIPVHNREGKLMCYSFRTVDDIEPKYLHPGFQKGRGMLFGEHQFEIEDKGVVNLVEGALDCVWMWQCGFRNTLAFLGIPGNEQANRIFEFGNKFRLCLDNDDAGKKQAQKLIKTIQDKGGQAWSIKLPEEIKDVQDLELTRLVKIINRR